MTGPGGIGRSGTADWSLLAVFWQVAESGSLSRAAERLGVSVPTVKRDIDSLEQLMGADLLVRSTRGVSLTPAGEVVRRHARSMADAASAIAADLSMRDHGLEGKVSIATGDALAAYWLAPRLKHLHQPYPMIEVELNVVSHTPSLSNAEVDISIQFEEPTHRDMIARKLGTLHYIPFASPEYVATYGQPETLYDLGKHRVLMHSAYTHQRETWPGKTVAMSQLLDLALTTNSSAVMLEACANGDGIAIMPTYVCAFDRRVVPLEHLPPIAPITFWATCHDRVRQQPRGRHVLDWIGASFDTAHHPWFRDTYLKPSEALNVSSVWAALEDAPGEVSTVTPLSARRKSGHGR
jgi:DNA-binding transcriptional LysR family regulator